MKLLKSKKKCSSLKRSVLVIAAFVLVGLMMMPEMGKNFGVGIARAQSGYSNSYINTGSNYNIMPPPEPEITYDEYQDECDTDYRNELVRREEEDEE